MILGVSYYPELVDETEWAQDLARMRDAGLRVVRALEFAWVCLEPREGVYQFDWLDRFLDACLEQQLRVILGTPTATPPAWLTTQYPEICIIARGGQIRPHGGRRDADVDNEIYRHYCAQICQRLGERYGNHPAVIGWQIDNELIGPEGVPPEVHTRAGTFRFRQYLKSVHGSVETLNQRWGMRFWSQCYSDWGEVTTPLATRSTTGLVLDYARYFTHSQVSFIRLQYDVLRAVIAPHQFITTNSTAIFDRGIDHVEYGRAVDVPGWDAYRGAAGRPYPEAFAAMAHDLFRSSQHKPFLVLETNAVNRGLTPAFVAEMHARGASQCVFWHWRSHRSGSEKSSDAICDYDGRPWEDRLGFTRQLAAREELQTEHPQAFARARAAILYCPDCVRTTLTPDPYYRPPAVSYLRAMIESYRVMRELGVVMDVVRPGDSLEGYELLLAPSPRLLARDAAARIGEWVWRGGVLLATSPVAHLDQWGTYYRRLGEPLSDVLGFDVRRAFTPPEGQMCFDLEANACPTMELGDRVTLGAAQALSHCTAGPWNGEPAATHHRHGRGQAFTLTVLAPQLLSHLARLACDAASLAVYPSPAPDVVCMPHLQGKGIWVFNHSTHAHHIDGIELPAGEFALVQALPSQQPALIDRLRALSLSLEAPANGNSSENGHGAIRA